MNPDILGKKKKSDLLENVMTPSDKKDLSHRYYSTASIANTGVRCSNPCKDW